MMKRILGAVTALAVTAAAGVAIAAYSGGVPLPAEFGGGQLPASQDDFKAEQAVAGELSKLAAAVAKCNNKGAKNVSNGKPSGVTACVGTFNPANKGATDKYAAKIAKINAKTPIPSCLNASLQGSIVATLTAGFNPIVYCGSPSGAFLDGAASF